MEEFGKILVDYGIAGAVLVMAWLAFRYIQNRDIRDTEEASGRRKAFQDMANSCHTSHTINTERVASALDKVGERLGESTGALQENSGVLRDVKEELRRKVD